MVESFGVTKKFRWTLGRGNKVLPLKSEKDKTYKRIKTY